MSLWINNRKPTNIIFTFHLPDDEHSKLCEILNHDDKWEELAEKWMNYDMVTISSLRREKNPTNKLLQLWSNGYHKRTIRLLFIMLSKMNHYRSMLILKPYVEEKYHALFDKVEQNLHRALDQNGRNQNFNDLKNGAQNFNNCISRPPMVPKVVIAHSTHEDSKKILNQPVQIVSGSSVAPSNSNNLLVASPIPGSRLSPILQNVASSLKNLNIVTFTNNESTLPQISYEELALATDNWSKRNILGKGGFGTVYKGILKNTDVAIKKIERRDPDSNTSCIIQLQQSLREIKILNSRPHDNILPLYAYNLGGEAPCLVYQFLHNGSLEDRLLLRQKTLPLGWLQRHVIAKGTACGLQYLHTIGAKPLIHGDIKSANILLDKNFEPKIGDFGLVQEGPEKESMKVSKVHGTRPYLPDEFVREKILSTKIDTYSYGIVMFELATGLPAYDDTRPKYRFLKEFVDNWNERDIPCFMDYKAGQECKEVYKNLITLGKWCSNRLPEDRPEMELVFRMLKDIV